MLHWLCCDDCQHYGEGCEIDGPLDLEQDGDNVLCVDFKEKVQL